MLDLHQLRYFVAVAETESIARAAERLHVSQSPLSRQVIAFERRLGLTLFARTRKRLRLTETGRRYLDDARSLLASAARFEARAEEEATGRGGVVNVGYVEGAVYAGVVPTVLRSFGRMRPGVRVEPRALRSRAQLDALSRGELDVGFMHRPAAPRDRAWTSRRVHVEPFLLALPKGHALAKVRPIEPAALAREPFVFLSPSASAEGYAEMQKACADAGFGADVRHHASELPLVLGLVSAGLGLAIVQANARSQLPRGVVVRPLPRRFRARLEVYVVAPPARSAAVQQLLDLCPPA